MYVLVYVQEKECIPTSIQTDRQTDMHTCAHAYIRTYEHILPQHNTLTIMVVTVVTGEPNPGAGQSPRYVAALESQVTFPSKGCETPRQLSYEQVVYNTFGEIDLLLVSQIR